MKFCFLELCLDLASSTESNFVCLMLDTLLVSLLCPWTSELGF